MVQNNKVLTVSYGTFSCTLEGFDDSFETMKAIAEYFRDLAADDRYFGSEPPQPDTEMLTRIAQRDASRRVEASQNDSGLLIRATEKAAPQPTPSASAPGLNVIDTPPPTPPSQPVFESADPIENTPAPAADSIAAKLQRIRAVVSHSEENSVIYTEDEDTTLMKSAGPSDAVAAAFEAGSLNPADLDGPAETANAAPAETIQEPPLEAPETFEAESETAKDHQVEEAEAPVQTFEAEEPTVKVETSDLRVEDEVAELEELDTSILHDEEDAATVPDNAAATMPEEEETTALPDVRFSELEETEEVTNILSDVGSDEEPISMDEGSILSEEDEIDLLEEISSVEDFLAKRAAHSETEGTNLDQDVSRLMDKVGQRLDDPDTSTKRETYSHMRAAIAATEAERDGKTKPLQDDDEDEYRGDLSTVVSPRRPEIQVTSERPTYDPSAPLKLVAEQRVDDHDADAGPVTPRRVTAEAEDDASEEGGFALFAQEQGAQSLPDLLEAAASYLSFIEGQEQFSRPQLMNKIRSLKQDDFNREESLRSFGQLLRDGKIEKAGGGRFAASTEIGFRPDDDERAAG